MTLRSYTGAAHVLRMQFVVLSGMPIKTNLRDLNPSRDRYIRSIQLISGGHFNGAAFPDGMITVYPWDFNVDEWLTTRIRKGALKGRSILFNVLPKVCNLGSCKLENFIASEVMLVLMVARSILRDDVVEFEHECPSCGHTGSDRIKVPDQLERIGEKKLGWPGYDLITLPKIKDVVKVKPLTIGEELQVLNRTDHERAATCSDSVARVMSGIIDVNDGKPDSAMELIQWFNALPPSDQEFLLEEFDKTQPQLSQVVSMECDSCGVKFDRALRLDEDFFRSAGGARHRKSLAQSDTPGVQGSGVNDRPVEGAGVANAKSS